MKLLREITLLLRNTLFVTVAVILGFSLGSAIGVPVWLQGFCLLPAALLFNWLSDGGPFAWGKVLIFLIVVSAFVWAVPHFPPHYRFLAMVVFLMIAPSLTKWLELRSGRSASADADTGASSKSS